MKRDLRVPLPPLIIACLGLTALTFAACGKLHGLTTNQINAAQPAVKRAPFLQRTNLSLELISHVNALENRSQELFPTSAHDESSGIDPYNLEYVNNYVKTELTSIRDAGGSIARTAIKDHNYDKNESLTRAVEYDWWTAPVYLAVRSGQCRQVSPPD